MYTIIGGDGREYGPATAEQVRQWIAAGRASLETQAKAAGTDEWKPLADYPEIVQPAGIEPPSLSGFAPSGGAPLASRGARLAEFLIDYFLLTLCCLPLILNVSSGPALQAMQNRDLPALFALPGVMVGVSITGLLWLGFVLLQVILLSVRGQSIGKWIMRVRVVRAVDGGHAGFVRAALIRYLVWGIIHSIPYIGFAILLVDGGCVFREDRRCLHDLMAGTKVVAVV